MKALRFHARGDFRVDDVAEPVLRDRHVIVDVEWCGICGSDLHEFESGPVVVPHAGPNPVTGEEIPVVLGHEFAGTVSAVAPGVTRVAVGDRVAVEPFIRCQECAECLAGRYNRCAKSAVLGVHGVSGGFSAHALVPDYTCHKLPDSISTDVGALIEPLAVAWHAVRMVGVKPGETALVMGAGPIGLATLLCLRAAGAGRVFAGVRKPGHRKDSTVEFGAHEVLDSSEADIVDSVLSRTGSRGVDVVIETSGAQEAMDAALAAVATGGRICSLAVWPEPGRFDFQTLMFKEAQLVGSVCYAGDFEEVIAAIADGRIPAPERLITKRVGMDRALDEGIGELMADRSRHLKVLVRPLRACVPWHRPTEVITRKG